jgi:alpha-beta hydrolase superfamily lysophospholipase/predicted outer membrane lipoprotein
LKTKPERLLLGLAVLLTCGFVVLNALAYRHAYAMMHFTKATERTLEPEKLTVRQKFSVLLHGVSLPRPETKVSPSALGAGARNLTLDSNHGITLGAWYCPGPPQSPLVILFHSYGGEKSGTLPEARAFLELGLSVLLVDFRGSGDSSESYTTIGFDEGEDVAAAVRYARERLPHPKVILYGESMGAAAILRAVHDCGVKPDAIILEAVFDNLLNTVRHRFELMGVPSFPGAELLVFWGGWQAGFNGFAHNPVRYAADVRCPILFLHGAADPRARVEEARRVFAAVPGEKTFKEFPRIGHEASVVRFPEEWKKTVNRFLTEVLAHSQPQ